ncbi:hypothetical protein ACW73L_15820 [Methylolobus aquaticus]
MPRRRHTRQRPTGFAELAVAARGRIIPPCGGDRKCMRIRVIAWTMVPDGVTGVQRETGNGPFSNKEAPNAFSIVAGSAALCPGRAG